MEMSPAAPRLRGLHCKEGRTAGRGEGWAWLTAPCTMSSIGSGGMP